jgi:hypothetical protein
MSNQYIPTTQLIQSGYYYNFGTSFNYDTIPYYDIGSVAVIGEFTLETITTITNSFNDCSYSYGLAIKITSVEGDIYYVKWDDNIITSPTGTFDGLNLTTDINEALLFERVTYDELKSLVSPPWGGFTTTIGPGYTVGDIQCWLRIINYRDVTQFQYFKISFSAFQAGLLTLNDVTTDVTSRPNEAQSWNIEPYSLPVSGCIWNCHLREQTTIWSRASGDCVDLSGATLPNGNPMTYDDLSEKRKAVIFQYKQNNAGFSKKQTYSRLARGIGRQRGQTFASQSETHTYSNTHNLVLDNSSVLLCPNVSKDWALTNQNDTPGPVRRITNYPTVPLTNYKVRRTYLAGGTKWPQYAWAPGMLGFPVRKKGSLR